MAVHDAACVPITEGFGAGGNRYGKPPNRVGNREKAGRVLGPAGGEEPVREGGERLGALLELQVPPEEQEEDRAVLRGPWEKKKGGDEALAYGRSGRTLKPAG